jgi:hypothetical protein
MNFRHKVSRESRREEKGGILASGFPHPFWETAAARSVIHGTRLLK